MTDAKRTARRREVLRAEARSRRDALSPQEREMRSARIAERLLGLPEVGAAGTVMLFWSFGSEVDTGRIVDRLAAMGKDLALPRVEGKGIVAVAYRPGDPVRKAWFGAEEPVRTRVLSPAEMDVVVTPGLAFDRAGHRLGYGGGFYDRLLRRVRPDAYKVAVAFELQLIDGVPSRGGDVAVDAIVTESQTIRCR